MSIPPIEPLTDFEKGMGAQMPSAGTVQRRIERLCAEGQGRAAELEAAKHTIREDARREDARRAQEDAEILAGLSTKEGPR